VMPLQFAAGTTRKTLALDGSEIYAVEGEPAPGAALTLVIERTAGDKAGQVERVPVTCRLDTREEISIYSAGGVLQRFAEDFLSSQAPGETAAEVSA
ncbi:hypothetical protein ACYTTR_20250, partial [Cobetia marina]